MRRVWLAWLLIRSHFLYLIAIQYLLILMCVCVHAFVEKNKRTVKRISFFVEMSTIPFWTIFRVRSCSLPKNANIVLHNIKYVFVNATNVEGGLEREHFFYVWLLLIIVVLCYISRSSLYVHHYYFWLNDNASIYGSNVKKNWNNKLYCRRRILCKVHSHWNFIFFIRRTNCFYFLLLSNAEQT